MNSIIKLNEVQIEEVRKLVSEQRRLLGFVETPIANDIFNILDNLGIIVLEYPIKSVSSRPAFSAALIYIKDNSKELVFIGLNTDDYFDKQIFALAHELYHYYVKTGSHLSRLDDEENNIIEIAANRFAAEFLLPEETLKRIIITDFKSSSLKSLNLNTLLRFITRLHCTWWLPYRSLVRRLKEIDAISTEQYNGLYLINERDLDGEYGRLGKAINEEIFIKLNRRTNNLGTSPKVIETIIRNFEDNLINVDQFIKLLKEFNKSPEDFGYNFKISDDDINEFNDFFNKEEDVNES
jgi:Zn-dependent peptidase ImmA (M78 family)